MCYEINISIYFIAQFISYFQMMGCYARFREIITGLSQLDLTFNNKIYVNYTDDIDPEFITNSEINFGVSVNKVGFIYPRRAVQFINQMVRH